MSTDIDPHLPQSWCPQLDPGTVVALSGTDLDRLGAASTAQVEALGTSPAISDVASRPAKIPGS